MQARSCACSPRSLGSRHALPTAARRPRCRCGLRRSWRRWRRGSSRRRRGQASRARRCRPRRPLVRGLGEQQRDVDVDALGDQPPHRGHAFGVPGTLIMRLGRSTARHSRRASSSVRCGVARELGRHFQAHVAVPPLRAVVDAAEAHRPRRGCRAARCARRVSARRHAARIGGARGCRGSRVPPATAFSKMAGFDVTPHTPSSSTSRCSSPLTSSLRSM